MTTKAKDEECQSKIPVKKPTAFELAQLFYSKVNLSNIDGQLHLYNPLLGYYCPLDKKLLEAFLLNEFYETVAASGSLRIVKTCAEIIMRLNRKIEPSADNKMQLCFKNGYIDLKIIEQASFIPYDIDIKNCPRFTYQIGANYTLNTNGLEWAKSLAIPRMDAFLETIADGNSQIITRIWQMIGYLLTPDTNGKCFFVLQGVPNSGKSVLGNFIKSLFPDHRIASLDIDQLGKRTATSLLVNKSLNLSMDLPNKALPALAIRSIKLITGKDDITVEYESGKSFRYNSSCKFLFATNHPLTIKGFDLGLEERIVCIPFTKSIPSKQRNNDLLYFLRQETNFIVAKALSYYRELRLSNYTFAGSDLDICKPKMQYIPTEAEDSDAHLCEFIDTKCTIVPIDSGKTFTNDLYSAYLQFCSLNGYAPFNDVGAFSRRLHKCYGEQIAKDKWRDDNKNQNGFKGIVLDSE